MHTDGNLYEIPETIGDTLATYKPVNNRLRFLMGDKILKYRYVNIKNVAKQLPAMNDYCNGLIAQPTIFNMSHAPRVIEDDGSYTAVVPHDLANRFGVPSSEKADWFIEDFYKTLVDEGLHSDAEGEIIDPSEFLKIMLFHGVIVINKGQLKALHNQVKKAQLINAINRTRETSERVLFMASVDEATFKAQTAEQASPTSAQMQMAI